VGPILAGILLLASQSQTAWQGALLLGAYSFGLGIPFLIAGALFSRLTVYLPQFYRYLPTISIISGILLFLIAVLMFTNSLAQLAAFGSFFSLEAGLAVESASNISLLLAFVAGLVSFLSPCVLPLVPAYLGYLSGATLGGQVVASGEPATV
jgi:cytochrome c-type biogenesis protein